MKYKTEDYKISAVKYYETIYSFESGCELEERQLIE